jgi:hypothetical protein
MQMSVASTISDQVAEMHAARGTGLAEETMAAFSREQSALAADGLPAGIVEVGVTVADTDLLDVHGSWTTLYRATAGRTSVIVFYRGAPTATSPSPSTKVSSCPN